MSAKVGLDCLLQVMSSGTFASPTFIDVKRIGDLTVADDKTAVDSSQRISDTKIYEAGMFERGFSFKLLSDANDPAYLIFRNAYRARGEDAKILVNVIDGAEDDTSACGLKMWVIVTKFGQEQPLDGRVARDVELKPAEKDGDVYEYVSGVADA
jgi:hypothetical protein